MNNKLLMFFLIISYTAIMNVSARDKDRDDNRGKEDRPAGSQRGADQRPDRGRPAVQSRPERHSGGQERTRVRQENQIIRNRPQINRTPQVNRTPQARAQSIEGRRERRQQLNVQGIQRSPSMSRSIPRQVGRSWQQRTNDTSIQNRRNITRNRQFRTSNWQDRGIDKRLYTNIGKNVRDRVNSTYAGRNRWFTQDFWRRHRHFPRYYNRAYNWWDGATAVGINSWLGWNDQPLYYDDYNGYDYGPNVYTDSNFYTNNLYGASQGATYDANTVINQQAATVEWMPLGVFALIKDGESIYSANMFVQLALTHDGSVEGTFYNATTDQAYAVEGIIDEGSQKVIWQIADYANSPKVEMDMYDLTEGEAPAIMYMPNGTKQNRILIRLESS